MRDSIGTVWLVNAPLYSEVNAHPHGGHDVQQHPHLARAAASLSTAVEIRAMGGLLAIHERQTDADYSWGTMATARHSRTSWLRNCNRNQYHNRIPHRHLRRRLWSLTP